MVNLRFLNAAIGKVSSDEFAVLYVIANNPKLQREGRVRLYREQIADMVGWLNDKRPEYGLKKVTKVTNSLEENGWLKKDVVFETTQKSVNYYSLNTQKIGEKCTSSEQKTVESSASVIGFWVAGLSKGAGLLPINALMFNHFLGSSFSLK